MTAWPLLVGLLLDAALGEPDWLWSRLRHPAVIMGQGVSALEARLNHGSHRKLRGVLALILLVLAAGATGCALRLLGPVAEALAAAILLAQTSLAQHVRAVAQGLRQSVPDGQRAVSMIVSRNTETMTQAQVSRAAIESASENLSDGVIAPAFWFLIGGAPGILIYKVVNTADSMIGYRTPRYAAFGWASARFDDLLNLIPARLTALLIAGPAGRAQWAAILADARRHKSPNAGWPEAAMARRINVALAGPRVYDGQLQHFPWVNDGAPTEIGPDQIDAAISVLWSAWRWAFALVLAIALVWGIPLWL